MKKRINFLCILPLCCFLAVCAAGCGQSSISSAETNTAVTILQETAAATEEQAEDLVKILEASGIICTAAKESDNPITEGMLEGFEAYDLTDKAEKEYLLIISSDNKSFDVVLDDENAIVEGLVSSASLPKWFELYGTRDSGY